MKLVKLSMFLFILLNLTGVIQAASITKSTTDKYGIPLESKINYFLETSFVMPQENGKIVSNFEYTSVEENENLLIVYIQAYVQEFYKDQYGVIGSEPIYYPMKLIVDKTDGIYKIQSVFIINDESLTDTEKFDKLKDGALQKAEALYSKIS